MGRHGAQLWRELRDVGFRGAQRGVAEWATRQHLMDHLGRSASPFAASPLRRVARLLTAEPSTLEVEERRYLDRLLAASAGSEMRSFADGLRQDEAAVRTALELSWRNGQTEGQITRLKLIKRQMFGRAKHDLLRARILQAA